MKWLWAIRRANPWGSGDEGRLRAELCGRYAGAFGYWYRTFSNPVVLRTIEEVKKHTPFDIHALIDATAIHIISRNSANESHLNDGQWEFSDGVRFGDAIAMSYEKLAGVEVSLWIQRIDQSPSRMEKAVSLMVDELRPETGGSEQDRTRAILHSQFAENAIALLYPKIREILAMSLPELRTAIQAAERERPLCGLPPRSYLST